MYRKLKRVLGISFIIFAIVLSQIPMESVQADTENRTESSNDFGESSDNFSESPDIPSESLDESILNSDDALSSENQENISDDETEGENEGIMLLGIGDQYTVTFVTGISNVTVQTITVNAGQKADIPTEIIIENVTKPLTKNNEYTINGANYTFKGWYETSDYNGTEYEFNKLINEDTTLYAKWETLQKYTISFVQDNGASNYPDNITVNGGKSVGDQPTKIPIRTGYEFTGWYTQDNTATVWNGWNHIISQNVELHAGWKKIDVKITFSYNGGTGDGSSDPITITLDTTTQDEAFARMAGKIYAYDGYSYEKIDENTDEPRWYKDVNGLIPCDKTEAITSDATFYLKWIYTTPEGFTLNANQAVLYSYANVNSITSVEVPNMVTTIVTGAFSEESLQNIGTILLPKVIRTIQDGAFPESSKISRTINLRMASDNQTLVEIARQLEKKYTYFKYITGESSSSSDTGKVNVISSLNDINTIEGNNGVASYAQFYAPGSLDGKTYTLNMDPGKNSNPLGTALKKKLGTNEAYPTGKIYYMELNLVNGSGNKESYVCSGGREYYTVIMPIPNAWAVYAASESDASKIFKVYTVDDATKSTLEEVEVAPAFYTSGTGIKCIEFHPLHFSEYALVYVGNGNNNNNNNNNNSNNNNSSAGNGNTNNSNSGGGSTGSTGSSSGNSNAANTTSSATTPITTNTSPVVPSVTDTTQVTQPTGTVPTGTGSGSTGGNVGHVKDSTPKTGDLMEYRTIMEGLFFSMGMLILLTGNKRKTRKMRNI